MLKKWGWLIRRSRDMLISIEWHKNISVQYRTFGSCVSFKEGSFLFCFLVALKRAVWALLALKSAVWFCWTYHIVRWNSLKSSSSIYMASLEIKVEALWFKSFIVFLENLVSGTFILIDHSPFILQCLPPFGKVGKKHNMTFMSSGVVSFTSYWHFTKLNQLVIRIKAILQEISSSHCAKLGSSPGSS